MSVRPIRGGVTTPRGFRVAAARAGLRSGPGPDVVLLASERGPIPAAVLRRIHRVIGLGFAPFHSAGTHPERIHLDDQLAATPTVNVADRFPGTLPATSANVRPRRGAGRRVAADPA